MSEFTSTVTLSLKEYEELHNVMQSNMDIIKQLTEFSWLVYETGCEVPGARPGSIEMAYGMEKSNLQELLRIVKGIS